jgi:hypothetical protein
MPSRGRPEDRSAVVLAAGLRSSVGREHTGEPTSGKRLLRVSKRNEASAQLSIVYCAFPILVL